MRPILFLTVLALIVVSLAGLPGSSAASADDKQHLRGEYTSSHHRGTKRLEATFTPNSDGDWNVVFRFDWDGRRTYSGTAEGSLEEGTLAGVVLDESRRRMFRFEGSWSDGDLFEGTHFEVRSRGRERATGNLVLRR